MKLSKFWFRLALNCLLGLVLIVIWLKLVDLPVIIDRLRDIKVEFVPLFEAFFVLSTIIRSLRLKLLLKVYQFSLKDLTALNFVGQFLSFVIPIRAGEVVKGTYLSGLAITNKNYQRGKKEITKTTPVSVLARSLIWVFLDRLFDFLGVLVLAVITWLLVPTFLPKIAVWIILAGFLGVGFSAWLIIFSQPLSLKLLDIVCRVFPAGHLRNSLLSFGQSVVEGFSILRRPAGELLSLSGLTLLALVSDSLILLSVFRAIGLRSSLWQGVLANSLFGLTFLIPSAPGYIGSAETYGSAVFISIFGTNQELSATAALLFHLLSVVTLPIFGLVSLYFLKLDLRVVWERIKN